MQAGLLRHRVSLQQNTPVRDEAGQPIASWAEVTKLWADVRFMRGLEALKSDAAVSVNQCSIRIRYRAGVTSAMRLVGGSTVYDIRAVLPDTTGKRYLDLLCETGANDG